jgi:molybdate transport system regulatory protein
MELRGKVWIEMDGRHLFGKGRAALLEAVASEGSIQAAARKLGMSYRKAWSMLHAGQALTGARLVETTRGGSKGGGARVTDFGRDLLRTYRSVEARFDGLLKEAQDEVRGPGR